MGRIYAKDQLKNMDSDCDHHPTYSRHEFDFSLLYIIISNQVETHLS